MQTMSHPVRRLSPPPDIAMQRISQTTLGLPASRPVKEPGSNQHRSIPLTPCRPHINQSTVRKFAIDNNGKVFPLHRCMIVCTMSVQCLQKSAKSLHATLCAYLAMITKKCARCRLLCLSASYLHFVCICLQQVCIKSAFLRTTGCSQDNQ